MKRAIVLFLAVVAIASTTGCATTYTSLRKVDDNSYVLTKTQHGFFSTYGSVYSCTPTGDNLKCTELGSL
jgi:hypothetical protein